MAASLARRFMQRFAGLERAHGTYIIGASDRTDAKNKLKGRALTKLEPVTEALWAAHLDGSGSGLGVVPIRDDASCTFGAIDIDAYDGLDLPALEAKCLALKFPLVICRSKSGGAHCYLFAEEPITAAEIRTALVEWSAALGYPRRRCSLSRYKWPVPMTSATGSTCLISMRSALPATLCIRAR